MTMLNVDLHSPYIKRKMTKEQFVDNLHNSDDCKNYPNNLAENIYDSIFKTEFTTGTDNTTRMREVARVLHIEKPVILIYNRFSWWNIDNTSRALR